MSALGRLAERLTAKRWTAEIAQELIGPFGRTWIAHATSPDVRGEAASGGAVSAILIDSLERGDVQGALVCRTAIEAGRPRARYSIATTPDEVLEARGSTYVLGDFAKDATPLIEAFDGTVAVVGLPCEIDFVTRRQELDDRAALKVSLFCGHATRPELVDALVDRLRPESGAELSGFRFRTGHWRGQLTAEFADGTIVERPFSDYGLYQNLYLFCARKCLACGDHFGYAADVSAGDVWSQRFHDDPIKHTALIAKTERGLEAVENAATGRLEAQEVPVGVVLDGQRRTAPFHWNVTARHRAGERVGITIPDRGQRARWHERAAASIVVRNYQRTEGGESAEETLGRSRARLKLQLWLLKGLESLS